MDGDLCLEKNRCRIDEADATTIDSSIEAERDRSEGVADCVSGGIPNVAKTSEIASCEADRAGVEEEERSVESGLGFRSGCESGGSDFSERKEMARTVVESGGVVEDAKTSEVDSCEAYRAGLEEEERSVERGLGFRILEFSDRKEMAGTVVESGGVVEDAQVFERFSVLEGEKDLESAVEVLVNVGEVKMMDFCCLNGDVVHQDEVQQNVLDLSTNQSCDAKPEIVMSVDDSQSEGIKMVSCNNSSEIHGFSGGDGARKVGEDYEMVEVQAVDENLSNGDGCGGRASRVNVTESKFDGSAVVVKEGKDHVVNCPFTASGDGISAGSMRKDFAGLDKKGIVNSLVNSKQELNGKEKRAWRNGNGMNKASGMNGNGPFGLRKCSGSKRTYSRKEMEALRHVNVEEQRKTWNKIYLGLGDVVARLLDTMGMVKPRNHGRRNDYHQNFENQKHKGPILRENGFHFVGHNFEGTVLGKVNSEDLKGNLKEPDPLYLACEDKADVHDDCAPVEEYDEDDDGSDDEYDSIQRPAFWVEGDPDFESGSPKDGLEFLRRVRWELKHVPKVKVVKVDISKISNEQSVYMPKIPDIAKCPEHLMPCKKWEDAFLADFADLRSTISQLESSYQQGTSNQPALSITEIESCPSNPALSFILQMDYVSRALLLKNWITSLESANTFSRKDCVWLFSLCASVDVPLDADMASHMRALLRKCSSLLAEKTEVDDEVVMLNILVTIAGKFFKQLDH